ncbi:hypothetical protein C8Q80DRAFT_1188522 [Daedaleopsis nitida]|nr:hypothetical protein C8Q80DRAFT_1188522 [Daedaleopsis nitida]
MSANKRSHEDTTASGAQAKKARQEVICEDAMEMDEEFWEEDGMMVTVARNVRFRAFWRIIRPSLPTSHKISDIFCELSPEQTCKVLPNVTITSIYPSHGSRRSPLQGSSLRYSPPTPSRHTSDSATNIRLSTLSQSLDFFKSHFTSDFNRWNDRDELLVPSEGQWEPVHAIGVLTSLGSLTARPSSPLL